MLPGYKYMNVAEELYEVFGGEIDWFHNMHGTFTFTNELFTPFNLFRKAAEGGFFPRDEELHAFNKYLLFGDGFVDWRKAQHPKYGEIEVGGFKKNWVRQPPSFLLEEECHRNMAFTLYHADQMPMVGIEEPLARVLPNGLVEVTARVVNLRVTPTRSGADIEHSLSPPDMVEITGEGINVVAGLQSSDRRFENAEEQKRKPEKLKIVRIPGQGGVFVRWLVKGTGPFAVRVVSQKGGISTATVE